MSRAVALLLLTALAGCAASGTTPDRFYTRIACEPGTADCDGMYRTGCETQIATDPAACGECGHRCVPRATCFDGTCRP